MKETKAFVAWIKKQPEFARKNRNGFGNEPYHEGLYLARDVSVLWKDRQTLPESPAHP
jgi:hypothetical protein